MFLIDTPGKAASKPAYTADGGGGWFTTGTRVSSEWLNHLQAELKAILDAAGVTLSKASDNQLVGVLKGALGVVAHATDTGTVSTILKRVLLGAGDSSATGDRSAVIASFSGQAQGENSMVAAADGSAASGSESAIIATLASSAGGDRSVVMACEETSVTGDRSAAIACYDSPVSGTESANIASNGAFAGNQQTANLATRNGIAGQGSTTKACANVAGDAVTAQGERCATIASHDSIAGAADESSLCALVGAADNATVYTDESAVIGCNGCTIPAAANNNTVILASTTVSAATHAGGSAAPRYSVLGGNGVNGWRLEGTSGNIKASGAITGGGLDVAEFFDVAGAIVPGVFVAHDPAAPELVRAATEGDAPMGITSTNPTTLGGDDSFGWVGRQLHDAWGRPLYDEVETVGWPAYDGPEALAPAGERWPGDAERYVEDTGLIQIPCVRWPGFRGDLGDCAVTPPAGATLRREMRPRLNPDFDPNRPHIPRAARPDEKCAVGILGQFRLRVTADVEPGMRVAPTASGHGRPADPGEAGARVMRIVAPFDAEAGYAVAWVYFSARS